MNALFFIVRVITAAHVSRHRVFMIVGCRAFTNSPTNL